MTKKSTLTTCAGGHLGGGSEEERQPDVAPMLSTGVNAEEVEEEVNTNEGEEDDNGALPIPGISERG